MAFWSLIVLLSLPQGGDQEIIFISLQFEQTLLMQEPIPVKVWPPGYVLTMA